MNAKNAATTNNGAVDRDFLVPQLSFATTSATGPPETKRHLRFSPTTMIMPTLALSDYTDKEYDATWTTEDDDVKSQQHLVQTIRLMQTNNGFIGEEHQEDFTARGLENMASSAVHERTKASKRRVVMAVLDKQERLLGSGKAVDLEDISARLATTSSSLSKEARDHALARGNRDATDISI